MGMNREIVQFNKNIKILRNKNSLSQEQLAEMIPVARQTVSAWEKKISIPDIEILAKICRIFRVSADQLLFGEILGLSIVETNNGNFYEEEKDYISLIRTKGYYDILEEDINEFFPIIYINISRIMGIVLELKEMGYQIASVYSNGFGIYFKTNQEAEGFSNVLYNIIEEIIHYEEGKIAVTYSENAQKKIDKAEIDILEEVHEKVFGAKMDDMYYWIDCKERIRGYAITKEGCNEQAKEQECDEYIILHE